MNKKIVTIVLHSLLVIATLASFAWLAYVNAVPSGAITYVQDFEHRTPFISDFWPPERIDPVMRGADGIIRPVVESPVSFFIHPTRQFTTGTIEMIFKLKDAATFELGLETGPEPEDVRVYQWQALESLPGDFWRGTLTVPMANWPASNAVATAGWWRDEDGRHHAQLLVSDLLEKKNVLFVKEVRVTLTGRPEGWREWWKVFKQK